MVDETFFDVFPLTWLDGSVKEFATPSTVVLNRTMARTFFGDEPAVGKYLQNGDGTRFRVVGVYEDMPANSSIAHQSFINLGEQYLEDEGEWSFSAYLKLRDPKEAKATQARVTESLLEYFGGNAEDATDEDRDEFRREFRISNLHKAYFLQDMYPSVSTVNKSMTITLLAIALLLIVIAIINFINFSFAEIPFRIKSINTRKVLGASRRSLIRSLLLRAAVLALVAFGLSCLFLRVVAGTSWASGVAESMTVRDYVAIILPMLGVTLCAAVVAGLAPALYSTSQPAALVLKGSYAMSFKGKTLRNALVGLQFVLSFVFILLGLYVDAQLRFMKNKDMGFRQENVLQVGCSQRAGGQLEALKGQLLQNPSILAVTASDNVIVGESRMSWGRRADDGTQVNMEVLPVADDFIDFFGLQIVDGRDFLPSDTQSESGCFIVNEAFMQRYPQFHVGSYIEGHETMSPIVGVVKDFYSKSLHHGVEPLVLYNWGSDPWRNHGVLYIRVAEGADFKAVSDYVKNTICSLDPALTPSQLNVRRLGEWIGSLYVVESVLHKLVTIASIVSTVLCGISMALAVLLAEALSPSVSRMLVYPVSVFKAITPGNVLLVLAFVVVLGILAGIVPALLIQRTQPIEIVRGTLRLKTKTVYSKVIIIVQNVVTVVMLVCAFTMWLQIRHMISADLGYNTKDILVVGNGFGQSGALRPMVDRLRAETCVEEVGQGNGIPLMGTNNLTMEVSEGNWVSFQQIKGDDAYFRILGMR